MINKLKQISLSDILTQWTKDQFLPNLNDIENEELKKLANKLKGDSDKQTLANILEWQHSNIQYWMERGILEIPWLIITPLYFFLCIIVATIFSVVFYIIILPFAETEWAIIVGLLLFFVILIFSMLQGTIIKVIYTLLFSIPVYMFIRLFIVNSPSIASIIDYGLTITLFNGVLFGGALFTIIYLALSYLPLFRRDPIKTKITKLFKILDDTFKFSLSIDRIINYKLAICRDYAKLTASLLFSLNPNLEVYFILIPRHVAVATKIKETYYVLDQHLPIMTLDRWLIRWNQEKADIYVSKVLKDSGGKPISLDFKLKEKVDKKVKPELLEIDTKKLTDIITDMLELNQNLHEDKQYLEISMKNHAIYYEDTDITKYSFIRAIKIKLENEFCSNMNKISKIRISQNERDLIVAVCF